MANHASAEKRNRQRIHRTERNRSVKSEVRTYLKQARGQIKASSDNAKTAILTAVSALDKAASKGTIPAKRASRLKSRLARAFNKATAAPAN